MSSQKTDFPNTRASLLLQLRSASNEAAWNDFVSIYQSVIYRIARKRRLQHADAQDLTQDILISVAGAIETFDMSEGSVRFRHWLRKVARNAIINKLTRKPKDSPKGGTGFIDDLPQRCTDKEELEQELVLEHRREIFARAAEAVQKEVAPETWMVFQLAVVEKIPIDMVAEQVNKSVGAAYACRGRVMNRLRRTIERMEAEPL